MSALNLAWGTPLLTFVFLLVRSLVSLDKQASRVDPLLTHAAGLPSASSRRPSTSLSKPHGGSKRSIESRKKENKDEDKEDSEDEEDDKERIRPGEPSSSRDREDLPADVLCVPARPFLPQRFLALRNPPPSHHPRTKKWPPAFCEVCGATCSTTWEEIKLLETSGDKGTINFLACEDCVEVFEQELGDNPSEEATLAAASFIRAHGVSLLSLCSLYQASSLSSLLTSFLPTLLSSFQLSKRQATVDQWSGKVAPPAGAVHVADDEDEDGN